MVADFTIIIPTFNEAESIRRTVNHVENIIAGRDSEILIVDDNSSDGTLDIIRDLSHTYPNVHVLVRLKDHGLSQSYVDAFQYASSPVIITLDADGQHPPEMILQLYQVIQDGNDIAIASRYMEGGGMPHVPMHRRILSWGATKLAQFFFPNITDSGSGFFAFRTDVIYRAPLEPRGFRMLFEILGKGKWTTAKEIPYTLNVRSGGASKLKMSTVMDYLKQLWGLLKYSIHTPESSGHKEIIRVIKFGFVGLSGALVNLSVLYALTEAGLWYVASSILGIELSVVTNFILNDNITFNDTPHTTGVIRRLGTYNVVCLGGITLMLSTTIFLTEILNVGYLLSAMSGICLAFVWNYSLSREVAWRK